MDKGLYFVCETQRVFGLTVSVVYHSEIKDFQIMVLIGRLAVAVGYVF